MSGGQQFETWDTSRRDTPPASPSILAGFRELAPAFLRQLRYEDYFVKRELPPTAKPYREIFHAPEMLDGRSPRPAPVRS